MLDFLIHELLVTEHYDLAKFLGLLPYIPIKIRKLFLTFCRVQTLQSTKLYSELADLETNGFSGVHVKDRFYTTRSLLGWMAPYQNKPLSCGLISMLLRVEGHMDPNELEMAMDAAVLKEMQAAIDPAPTPEFNFECLFSNDPMDRYTPLTKNHADGHQVATYFHNRISSLRDSFTNDKIDPIIPTYARKKNVSRSMARSYNQYSNSPLEETDVTALDCLKLYSQTGFRAGGFTEMRTAFRYTDLAPRAYYAVGGDAYWKANHVKHFAKRLTTCLPVTSPTNGSRYNISRLKYRSNQTVLLYDYSAFTSNLPALYRFLRSLADFFQGTPYRVFDPYLGVITLDLGDVINDYNESIDEKLLFSMERLYPTQYGEEEDFYMAKNGPLGAQGNINFSMILHGLNMALAIDDLNLVNVVGDDAIVLLDPNIWEKEYILGVINLLGEVAERKTIWIKWEHWMEESDVEEASWHFMKRPLRVYSDRIAVGQLVDVPSYSLFLPDDGYHVTRGSKQEGISKFIAQIGVFFDDVLRDSIDFDIWEVKMIIAVFRAGYKKLELPFQGSFPGRRIHAGKITETVLVNSIPPLTEECFRTEWREVLWDGTDGEMFQDHDYSYKVSPYGLELHWDWTLTDKNRLVSLFVDFGLMEMRLRKRWYDRGDPVHRRQWLESKDPEISRPLYETRVVTDIPDVFSVLYTAYSR